MGETLLSLLERAEPARPAMGAPGGAMLSYGELRSEVEAVAGQLRAAGVAAGDVVGLSLPNGPGTAVALLAAAVAGRAAPLNPKLTAGELAGECRDFGAAVLIASDGAGAPPGVRAVVLRETEHGRWRLCEGSVELPGAAGEWPGPEPGDFALLLHTSGTTSRPKTVPLTHANLVWSAGSVAQSMALGAEDRGLAVMPLFHIHGIVAGLLAPLLAGGSVAVPAGFEPFAFAGQVEASGSTWYSAVPSMHEAVVRRVRGTATGTRLRAVRSSSSALAPRLLGELEALFGAPVIEAYGMTEAAHQLASNPLPPGERRPGSVGLAAGAEVRILGEEGDVLASGREGEVAIRGAGVTAGYLDDPDANAAAWADGWLRTGDLGRLDADGYLWLTGRKKELINRGGEKVSPREVEEVLLAHPAVAACAVFGAPHATLGEEVAALVVPVAGAELGAGELRAWLSGRLAPFKAPRTILVREEIPVGPTGKVQRTRLAEQLGIVK